MLCLSLAAAGAAAYHRYEANLRSFTGATTRAGSKYQDLQDVLMVHEG